MSVDGPVGDAAQYDTSGYRKQVCLYSAWAVGLLTMFAFEFTAVPLAIVAVLFGAAILLAAPPDTRRLRARLLVVWMFSVFFLPILILGSSLPLATVALIPTVPIAYLMVARNRSEAESSSVDPDEPADPDGPLATTSGDSAVTEPKSPLGEFDGDPPDTELSWPDEDDRSPERPSPDDSATTVSGRERIFERQE